MYRWGIFCSLCIYLLLSSRPAVATVNARPGTPAPATVLMALDGNLDTLAHTAELIVQGQVLATRSFWNAEHTLIESEATVAVTHTWLGHVGRTIQVRTTGGYLADAQLGLISMHEATFTPGETVLLFAQRAATQWRVLGGTQGKFQVQHGLIFNSDLPLPQARSAFVTHLADLIATRQVPTAATFVQRTAQLRPLPSLRTGLMPTMSTQGAVQKWATPHATANFYLNLNTTQVGTGAGDAAAFRAAITGAAQSWSGVAGADFALTYGGQSNATQTGHNGINEVLFMHKGATERAAAAQVWYRADGTIIEADIWINDDYRWNATGQPAADEVDLQSALLHEFGHWLILGHTDHTASVMFPRLATGTTKRNLQAEDMAGISAIYPR